MSSEREFSRQPFKTLGNRLRTVRQKANQSLAEVSGAVEVDEDFMKLIEQGEQRPSEEVLLLLISHFNIEDGEATDLWEMAGYSDDNGMDSETAKSLSAIFAPDLRIIYSDMVYISANDSGLTMNFMQSAGLGGQPMIISRLGMSHQQAKNVLQALQNNLDKIDKKVQPKLLPQPKAKKTDT